MRGGALNLPAPHYAPTLRAKTLPIICSHHHLLLDGWSVLRYLGKPLPFTKRLAPVRKNYTEHPSSPIGNYITRPQQLAGHIQG